MESLVLISVLHAIPCKEWLSTGDSLVIAKQHPDGTGQEKCRILFFHLFICRITNGCPEDHKVRFSGQGGRGEVLSVL